MNYDPDPAIELTWAEVWEGAQEGSRRWLKARMLQRPTGNGRWDAEKSEIEFDWTGALAERAFAKKLDAPWAPLHHPDRYHSNHDVAGWHVKGTRHAIDPEHPDKPRLQQPLTADPDGRYVLLSGWTGLADLTDWTIVGWGIGRELFDKRWITTHLHGPPCYWIPHHALRDWPPHFLQTAGLHP